MKRIILVICLTLLLASCTSPPRDDYIKRFEDWQTGQYQELRQEYDALFEQLLEQSQKLAQRDAELATSQRQVANSQNEINRLNGVITSLPPKQVFETRWQELINTRQVLADITAELALARNSIIKKAGMYEILRKKYNNLAAAVVAVNNKTDETTTSNLTEEKRDNFYEMWGIWYGVENIGQYQEME